MNKQLLLGILMAASFSSVALSPSYPADASPFTFVENIGQITNQNADLRTDIDFRISGRGVHLYIGGAQMHYQWLRPIAPSAVDEDMLQEYVVYRMDVTLVGADPNARVIKEEQQHYYERYYNDRLSEQGGWAHSYHKVIYKDVYPHIDWILYIKDHQVEYDFMVHPGGKVSDIRLKYSGASSLEISRNGGLTVTTPFGTVSEAAPVGFQKEDSMEIASAFILEDDILSFYAAEYTGTLVIDPLLEWATYFGGDMNESTENNNLIGYGHDALYMIGNTPSVANIATEGSHQDTIAGGTDGLVARFNAAGELQWCTYYGGSNNNDRVLGIDCDSEGNVYICGYTQSTAGISTVGSYQEERAGSVDGFLAKFNEDGERQWGTYFGGSSADQLKCLAVNVDDEILVGGYTQSTEDIATPGAYQEEKSGSKDALVAKFDAAGALIWSTYFGGNNAEEGMTVTCDTNQAVIISGWTQSTEGIADEGTHQSSLAGGTDIFLAKFEGDGTFLWSTYYGGDLDETAYSMVNDGDNIYLTGYTQSESGISTEGSYAATITGVYSGFLSRFSTAGTLEWATYYGGALQTYGNSLMYTPDGKLIMGGFTSSESLIADEDALQPEMNGDADAFLVCFDHEGIKQWSTYYGGDGEESIRGIYVDATSQLYICGYTSSTLGLATDGAYQSMHGGGADDLFLTKINICEVSVPEWDLTLPSICEGEMFTMSVLPVAAALEYEWIIPESWEGSSSDASVEVTARDVSGSVGVCILYSCGISDTLWQDVEVFPAPEPVIIATGSVLSTTAPFASYQWYHNEEWIEGATDPTYTMTELSGYYTVEVSNEYGCTAISEPFSMLSGTQNDLPDQVRLYPNPTSEKVYIVSAQPFGLLQLIDMTGTIVLEDYGKRVLNLASYRDGVYLLCIYGKEGGLMGRFKVVKK